MSEKVKCVNCGMLAMAKKATSELAEFSVKYRKSDMPENALAETDLHCLAMEVDIQAEIKPPTEAVSGIRLALDVIYAERSCDKFTRWRLGYSPKEIAQMLYSENMVKMAEQRVIDNLKWQEEQTQLREARWAKEDKEKEEREAKRDKEAEERKARRDEQSKNEDRKHEILKDAFIVMLSVLLGHLLTILNK